MKNILNTQHAKSICFAALTLLCNPAIARTADGATKPVLINQHNGLLFMENKGQIKDQYNHKRNDIDVELVTGTGFNIFIGQGQMQYQWNRSTNNPKNPNEISMRGIVVELIGANKKAIAEKSEQQSYHENYYVAGMPHGTVVNSYSKITYRNIYPNIDWVLYTKQNTANTADKDVLKYDFIVHPGGNVKDIQLKYTGANALKLVDGGTLAQTEYGDVREEKPYSYYADTKEEIATAYVLKDNVVSFDLNTHNNGTIVIDPQLNWGTYYGYMENTEVMSTIADSFDNAFICGKTFSNTGIASLFTWQTTYGGGNSDCFIAKFYAANSVRAWATYYGGYESQQINAAAIDPTNNNIYVTGLTNDTVGMSTTGAHQLKSGGNGLSGTFTTDAFLAKFNDAGLLQWSTYYGGSMIEIGTAIAVDKFGYVYMAGSTSSTNAITTSGCFQNTPGPGFIAKFSSSGTRQWGTYFNGAINSIKFDRSNNMYFAGYTDITSNVSTTGSHMPVIAGGTSDGFLEKFTDGGSRIWGTYYGGTNYDEIFSICIDSFQNIYCGGSTVSYTGIATSGAFQANHSGNPVPGAPDAFLAKFNPSGVRMWGTYYGDSIGYDAFRSLSLGPDGKIYAAGGTGSQAKIATPGNFSTTNKGPFGLPGGYYPEGEMMLIKFSPKGERLWGTYYGGSALEWNPGCAYANGKIYLGGSTESTSGIATSSTWQSSPTPPSGKHLGFLAEFQADTSVYIKYPYVDTAVCIGDSLKIRFAVTNDFKASNVFTVQLSDSSGSFATYTNIGSLTANRAGTVNCKIPNSVFQSQHYRIRIVASAPADTFYNYDIDVKLWRYFYPQAVSTSPICENMTLTLDDASGDYAPDYLWTGPGSFYYPSTHNAVRNSMSLSWAGDYYVETDNHGCKARDTVKVTVIQSPADPVMLGDTSICLGDTLHLTGTCTTPGVTYLFQDNNLVSHYVQDFIIPVTQFSDSGVYKVASIMSGVCASAFVARRVHIRGLPLATATNNTPVCEHDTVKLHVTDTMTNVSSKWWGPLSFSSSAKDTNIINGQQSNSGVYTVVTTSIYGCTDTATTTVAVKELPAPVDASNNGPICSRTQLQLSSSTATTGSFTYNWAGPGGFTSNQQNPIRNLASTSFSGVYRVTINKDGCTSTDTTTVTIYQSPDKPLLTSDTPKYVGEVLNIGVNNIQSGATYQWRGPNSYGSTNPTNALPNVVTTMGGWYVITVTIGNCKASDSMNIEIKTRPEQPDKTIFITPIPNRGIFNILASVNSDSDVPLSIYTTDGKLVHTQILKPVNKKLNGTIDISGKVSTGIYRLKILIDGKMSTHSVLIGQ